MKKSFILLHLVACMMLLAVGLPLFAQKASHDVSGVVTDELGPVPGAQVLVEGTTVGTMTDDNGSYYLKNVPEGATLQVVFIGYKTAEATITGESIYNFVLQEDANLLDELVVIGYGTVKKSDLTGSVASVSEDDMTKSATSDPLQAIQGRAAGVQIISATGSPDATAEIKIRGTGSPNGTTPLYVVDGFPMNDIDYLSPNDIASVEILKDASASAIYGSRGANGVVLITTKKGQSGALRTKVTAEFGIENIKNPDMLSSSKYATLTNEAYANSGLAPKYSNPNAMEYNTNWFDEVMRLGRYQNYSISLSGGSDKINTIFTTNYFRRDGTIKSTAFERINFSQNTTINVTKWLKFTAALQGSFGKTIGNGLHNNTVFLSSLIAPPDIPVINENTGYFSGINVFRLANPAGEVDRNNGVGKRNNLIGNFSADVTIMPGLVFTSRFGYRYTTLLNNSYSPVYYETSNISNTIDTVYRSTTEIKDWTWENMLTWNKNWNDVHDLTVMGAVSAREYSYEDWNASKQDLPNAASEFHYFDAASKNPLAGGKAYELSMLSYLGRINYSLLGRYILTASFRADGSSRFLGNNRWGYFPSGAFAWRVSEEPFFQNIDQDFMSNLKFRIGWGQIGNERINSYYPYMTAIRQQNYYTLGTEKVRTNGSVPGGIGNKDVKWETSEQFNVGLDMGFLNDRLNATVDYYIRKTDNILLAQAIPHLSGFSTMTRNVGGMENKGLELTIGWKDNIGELSYDISGNISFNKNEVTDLGTADYLSSTFAYDQNLTDFQGQFTGVLRSEVGHAYNQFYGYRFKGIFQNQSQIDSYKSSDGTVIMPNAKPGDSIYADLNDDGKINSSDMEFIGNPNPKAIFGLSVGAEWKNFDLSVLFQGVIGNDVFNASKFYFEKFDGRQNVFSSVYGKAWSGDGSSNEYPILLSATSDKSRIDRNWRQSDFYVENGSYLRLKTLQIGYNFKPVIGDVETGIRLYVSMQNLFTITGYSGVDPEIPDNGIDRGQYPQPRTFMIGANINF